MFFRDISSCKDIAYITLALAIELCYLLCCGEGIKLFGSDVGELAYFLGRALVCFDLIFQEVEYFEQQCFDRIL